MRTTLRRTKSVRTTVAMPEVNPNVYKAQHLPIQTVTSLFAVVPRLHRPLVQPITTVTMTGTTYGCCPTQAYTCSLSYKSGASCGPAVTRWYYDSTTRTCQTYSFNGCDGNSNNFATQQDCKDYCRVESCPDGGEVGALSLSLSFLGNVREGVRQRYKLLLSEDYSSPGCISLVIRDLIVPQDSDLFYNERCPPPSETPPLIIDNMIRVQENPNSLATVMGPVGIT
ncbi:Kunitz/Bovine pancreatic trypsin inhibitor domain protein [Cooperia oncophora]